MKRVAITVLLECADDVPERVIDWMAGNLADHASNEFGSDYEPEWNDPPYGGPPLVGHARANITILATAIAGGSPSRPVCAVPGCVCLTDPAHAYCVIHRRRQTRAMRDATRRLRANQESGATPHPGAAESSRAVLPAPWMLDGRAVRPLSSAPASPRQHRGSRHQRGYDRAWVLLRERFVADNYPWFCAIDGVTCQASGRMMFRHEIQVDHIQKFASLSDPLRLDVRNIRIVCAACHAARHAHEARGFRGAL